MACLRDAGHQQVCACELSSLLPDFLAHPCTPLCTSHSSCSVTALFCICLAHVHNLPVSRNLPGGVVGAERITSTELDGHAGKLSEVNADLWCKGIAVEAYAASQKTLSELVCMAHSFCLKHLYT